MPSSGNMERAEQTNNTMLEYRLDSDAPRLARAYAIESIAAYDSGVACFDAKCAYWAIRPFQLDPTLNTVFPTPNHPSYPAAHGCFSSAAAAALAYLFPRDAETLNALADEAAQSRIWGGIHFPTDVRLGLALGRGVAQKVIDLVQGDQRLLGPGYLNSSVLPARTMHPPWTGSRRSSMLRKA